MNNRLSKFVTKSGKALIKSKNARRTAIAGVGVLALASKLGVEEIKLQKLNAFNRVQQKQFSGMEEKYLMRLNLLLLLKIF